MEQLHVSVSLREMYEEGLLEDGRILNALSLPCSTSYSGHLYSPEYPVSVTSFWLVARKEPLVTFIQIVLVSVPSLRFFAGGSCDPEEWTAEVVLLEPGSALCSYMHPNTHHAVVTLENSIVKGHHFYSTVTLSKTVLGWVHTCMLGYTITNILHVELQEVLLRMMCYFGAVISDQGPENHDTDIPTMTRDGPLDFIALGNLCLFAPALPIFLVRPKMAEVLQSDALEDWSETVDYDCLMVKKRDPKDEEDYPPTNVSNINDGIQVAWI
ncbi:uncharacterized protein EV420DRAFT_1485658 [Desarmillaria tabescens]|uniref:Uncharacterized protein n=1 Tax=Armillaria tabescens TaxID=1929756 RepID=A0AA39MPZ6_ARMTA|nr:uncharacterized protein EV420DRAFT_1485658 [Desarmillaria tabescens]KAK0441500.1 hypothetical protein EV420DRAFT_1485658 [Desarmillaria tabescens]